ncbi:WD40 repeat-containing protein, putative [Bodo saltans]|uniref:Probable cytosolic iron-sulfur protein assembly protein CIAO1 homolog n=1 Tax=Bodo saltans TaxID=75058 RepID=A0A0S4JE56_BODSA|nr:WD40 repeat-containing protein, putative [Bodo saltans]|eukprot:CUG87711.1 WD40 repeat-containing protein, putative [Bodo saltans]
MQFASKIWSAVSGGGSSQPTPAVGDGETAPVVSLSLPLHVERIAALIGHEDRVWSVAWHPTLPLLASCSGDKTVKLWSPSRSSSSESGDVTWALVTTLEGEHQRTVRHVEWSPNGLHLSCSSFDSTVTIWKLDVPSGDEEQTTQLNHISLEVEAVLEGHENEVKCCTWAEGSNDLVATCSRDKTVWVWERADPEEPEFECGGVLSGHSQDVKSVRWLPASVMPSKRRSLLSCSYDGTMKLWEENPKRRDDWHCTQTLTHGELGTVWEAALEPSSSASNSRRICAATEGGALRLWRQNEHGMWAKVGDVSISDRPLFSVDWQGPLVVAASGDNHIAIIHFPTVATSSSSAVVGDGSPLEYEIVGTLTDAHEADVNTVRFAPFVEGATSWTFASAGDDGVVNLWRVSQHNSGAEQQQ